MYGNTLIENMNNDDEETVLVMMGALTAMGVVVTRASHDAWTLARHTNALDVGIQMFRGLSHMSAISVASGRHAVVDGAKRLSTGLAALYSVITPKKSDAYKKAYARTWPLKFSWFPLNHDISFPYLSAESSMEVLVVWIAIDAIQ